jgi:hypothetical protein
VSINWKFCAVLMDSVREVKFLELFLCDYDDKGTKCIILCACLETWVFWMILKVKYSVFNVSNEIYTLLMSSAASWEAHELKLMYVDLIQACAAMVFILVLIGMFMINLIYESYVK